MRRKAQLFWAGFLALAASPVRAEAPSSSPATPDAAPEPAQRPKGRPETVSLTLVRPGAGFLVADGASVVPLEIRVSQGTPSRATRAKVSARAGKVLDTTVLSSGALALRYQTPRANAAVSESLEVSLTFPEGEVTGTLAFEVPAPAPPKVELSVVPEVLSLAARRAGTPLQVEAQATGDGLRALELSVAPGRLESTARSDETGRRALRSQVSTSALPDNEPSCVLAVAAATSPLGFAARSGSSALEASLRLDVEIPPKSELLIEGATSAPPPAPAGPDGHAVLEGVVVRYGAEVRAFARRGNKKTEVSVAIPSLISPGLVLPIPGQAVADGGTGPSVLVAVPPSPFGEAVLWPELEVQGAELVGVTKISEALRALILKRPTEPKTVTVLLDEQSVGEIEFGGRHGARLAVTSVPREHDERAAVEVRVIDENGAPADAPRPVVRLAGGPELETERLALGRYRAAITATVAAGGAPALVVAELAPPPVLATGAANDAKPPRSGATTEPPPRAAALEGAKAELSVELALFDVERARLSRSPEPTARARRFSLAATAQAGRTFSALTVFGGGVLGELRLPFVGDRIAVRAGASYVRSMGTGSIAFPEQDLAARTVLAGLWIPVDVGFAVISSEGFELAVRGGGTLRIEQGLVRVEGDVTAGGDQIALAGQGSVDAAFSLSVGTFFAGVTVDGLGARADGFASDGRSLRGTLTSVRGDFGYKFWF